MMPAATQESTTTNNDPKQQTTHWTGGDIWIHDHWTEEEKAEARDRLLASSTRFRRGKVLLLDEEEEQEQAFQQFRRNASTNWNVFYNQNKTNFFKDRHYLHKSFPDEFGWLYDNIMKDDAIIGADVVDGSNHERESPLLGNGKVKDVVVRIIEVGCGVGNAILPLLEQHSKLMQQYTKELRPGPPQLHIHCLDFAPNAIELLKKDARFQAAAKEGRATAHVYDLSSTHPSTIKIDISDTQTQSLANTADVAILLFCLSAIGPHPSLALRRAARNVIDMLRPGGVLLFRDYGRLDEAQMKLGNADKELSNNFYRKGDGTGCYYFTLEDVFDLFVNEENNDTKENDKLEQLELDYIQRLYRNRNDGTTRRRVWIQGRFRKKNCGKSSDAKCVDVDPLQEFMESSIRRWDDHYRGLPKNTSSSLSLPVDLFKLFPNEFLPWIPWLSSNRNKEKPQYKSQARCGTPTHITVVDLGCGLGNETLLNLVEWQMICHGKDQHQNIDEAGCGVLSSTTCSFSEPPLLNVHFIDASNEALNRIRKDPRYKLAATSIAEHKSLANVACQVCNIATTQPTMDRSADIILLLFTLSAIGPYTSGRIRAVQHAVNMLNDNGVILFRDYARYDDDQLQLNSVVGAQLCDNFYIRGEKVSDDHHAMSTGTGCYFFELEEVRELFTNAGLEVLQLEYDTRVTKKSGKNGRDCSRNGGAVSRTRVCVSGRFRKMPPDVASTRVNNGRDDHSWK